MRSKMTVLAKNHTVIRGADPSMPHVQAVSTLARRHVMSCLGHVTETAPTLCTAFSLTNKHLELYLSGEFKVLAHVIPPNPNWLSSKSCVAQTNKRQDRSKLAVEARKIQGRTIKRCLTWINRVKGLEPFSCFASAAPSVRHHRAKDRRGLNNHERNDGYSSGRATRG